MLFLFVLFFCSQCLSGLFFEKNLVFLLLYSANTMLVGKLFLYFSPPPPPPPFFFFFFFFLDRFMSTTTTLMAMMMTTMLTTTFQ